MSKTPKGRATKKAFQEAARRVFARDGYLNTRIADIAAEAGKATASFYNYFDSKEALLADLAADYNAELQEMVAEPYRRGLEPRAALREAILAFWEHYERRLPDVLGIFQASMVDPEFAAVWREIRTDGIRTIATGITQAQRDGDASKMDPYLAASALSSMIEHFCYVWQAQGGDAIGVELNKEDAVETLWLIWSRAIFCDDNEYADSEKET